MPGLPRGWKWDQRLVVDILTWEGAAVDGEGGYVCRVGVGFQDDNARPTGTCITHGGRLGGPHVNFNLGMGGEGGGGIGGWG